MNIAIVGAGLAGLGLAYYLAPDHRLTIFYDKQGASHAASGLMHAFVGDTGEKAFEAEKAMLYSQTIIKSLKPTFYRDSTFKRKVMNPTMEKNFSKYEGQDLEWLDKDHVLIKEGLCINVPEYLKALIDYLKEKGVTFIEKKIETLASLEGFDSSFICAGFGIKELVPKLKLKYLKGQSLTFQNLHTHSMPYLAKGYLVPFDNYVVIGSTYERNFESDAVDIYAAYRFLEAPLQEFYQPYDKQTPVSIQSGIRVAHPNVNYPRCFQVEDHIYALTGYGSRGLLYHGYLGYLISEKLKNKEVSSAFFVS